MTQLEKAMEDFANALRPIRALFETLLAVIFFLLCVELYTICKESSCI